MLRIAMQAGQLSYLGNFGIVTKILPLTKSKLPIFVIKKNLSCPPKVDPPLAEKLI
jgi:hypothetical protein